MKWRKRSYVALWVLPIVVSVSLFSCTSDEGISSSIDCSGVETSFTAANAIIQQTCATTVACHRSGSTNGPGPLLTYTQIYSARSRIETAVASGTMPRGSTLSSNEKNTIICWIRNGAAEN